MNPELLADPGYLTFIAMMLILGAVTIGFLIGFLVKNYQMNEKLQSIEDALEKKFGTQLDEYFDE